MIVATTYIHLTGIPASSDWIAPLAGIAGAALGALGGWLATKGQVAAIRAEGEAQREAQAVEGDAARSAQALESELQRAHDREIRAEAFMLEHRSEAYSNLVGVMEREHRRIEQTRPVGTRATPEGLAEAFDHVRLEASNVILKLYGSTSVMEASREWWASVFLFGETEVKLDTLAGGRHHPQPEPWPPDWQVLTGQLDFRRDQTFRKEREVLKIMRRELGVSGPEEEPVTIEVLGPQANPPPGASD